MRDACCVNPRTVESLFGVCVAKLNELKSFGELALQGKGLRAASIITSEEVGLMTVDKPTFDDILGSYNETQKQHKVAWFHAVQQGDTKKIRKLTNLGFSVETRLPSVEVFNRAPEFPGSHRFVDHFGTRCRRRSFVSHSPPLCLPLLSVCPQLSQKSSCARAATGSTGCGTAAPSPCCATTSRRPARSTAPRRTSMFSTTTG
jgi:hypothetical protein